MAPIRTAIALSLLTGASLPAQDATAALERFRMINVGEYQMRQRGVPLPSIEDVQLCLDHLDSESDAVRSYACLALSALMRYPFYGKVPAEQTAAIHARLIAYLDHSHDDTAEWTARAVRQAERHGHLAASERRTTASRALGIVLRDDPDSRRRAALVLADLRAGLPAQMHPEIARTLMLVLERYPKPEDDSEKTAASTTRGVLAQLDLGTTKLARELAEKVLADLVRGDAFGFFYDRRKALRCLGRHVGALTGTARARAVDLLIAGVGDRDLLYMVTSGVRSPMLHAGGEALAEAWPHLQATEQQRAREAVANAKRAWASMEEMDRTSIFGPLDELVAR